MRLLNAEIEAMFAKCFAHVAAIAAATPIDLSAGNTWHEGGYADFFALQTHFFDIPQLAVGLAEYFPRHSDAIEQLVARHIPGPFHVGCEQRLVTLNGRGRACFG